MVTPLLLEALLETYVFRREIQIRNLYKFNKSCS
jgi:hypothetical protein